MYEISISFAMPRFTYRHVLELADIRQEGCVVYALAKALQSGYVTSFLIC